MLLLHLEGGLIRFDLELVGIDQLLEGLGLHRSELAHDDEHGDAGNAGAKQEAERCPDGGEAAE
jgi:hypothetical protein